MSTPPAVLVKVVHGGEVRMKGGGIRHGGEIIRVPHTMAKTLAAEGRVKYL